LVFKTLRNRYFSQRALTITKLRNRLNKDTFNIIMCSKSWGTIIEDKEAKEDANKDINIKEAKFNYK
jgi:hypothetical protein